MRVTHPRYGIGTVLSEEAAVIDAQKAEFRRDYTAVTVKFDTPRFAEDKSEHIRRVDKQTLTEVG